MKTLKWLLAVPLLAVLMAACDKDDDNDADGRYLKTTENMPTFVLSEFRTQMLSDYTTLVSSTVSYSAVDEYTWRFGWDYRYYPNPKKTYYEIRHGSADYRVFIWNNGNVDFRKNEKRVE